MSKERKINSGAEFDETPITTYYKFKAPNTPHPLVKVLKKDQEIKGEFQHTFVGKVYGDKTHLIKTESGEKVTVSGCTTLNRALETLARGARVRLVFKGRGKPSPGQQAPWIFDVFETVSDDAEDAPVAAPKAQKKAAPAPELEETSDEEELDEEIPF